MDRHCIHWLSKQLAITLPSYQAASCNHMSDHNRVISVNDVPVSTKQITVGYQCVTWVDKVCIYMIHIRHVDINACAWLYINQYIARLLVSVAPGLYWTGKMMRHTNVVVLQSVSVTVSDSALNGSTKPFYYTQCELQMTAIIGRFWHIEQCMSMEGWWLVSKTVCLKVYKCV